MAKIHIRKHPSVMQELSLEPLVYPADRWYKDWAKQLVAKYLQEGHTGEMEEGIILSGGRTLWVSIEKQGADYVVGFSYIGR